MQNSMILTTSRFSPQNTKLNDRNSAIFMPRKQNIYQEFDELYNNNNSITSEVTTWNYKLACVVD